MHRVTKITTAWSYPHRAGFYGRALVAASHAVPYGARVVEVEQPAAVSPRVRDAQPESWGGVLIIGGVLSLGNELCVCIDNWQWCHAYVWQHYHHCNSNSVIIILTIWWCGQWECEVVGFAFQGVNWNHARDRNKKNVDWCPRGLPTYTPWPRVHAPKLRAIVHLRFVWRKGQCNECGVRWGCIIMAVTRHR